MNDQKSRAGNPPSGVTEHSVDSGARQCAAIDVTSAAKLLGISRGLAYLGVRDGSIPALRVGKRWLVPRAALDALLGK